MSNLNKSYNKIKPSVVAIVARLSRNNQFPDILGTGFIVRENGLILTNRHVVQAISKLPRLKNAPVTEFPAQVNIFHNQPGIGNFRITADIKGVFSVEVKLEAKYGAKIPDIGFLQIAYKNLPAVEIENEPTYEEGQEIGVAGFPMGTDLLLASGKLDQITPTLKKGIIGAILPFRCRNPHSLLLDVLSQGGSSGSPVFDIENGKVVGVLYGGMEYSKSLRGENGVLIYKQPTGISYAVPSHTVVKVLDEVDKNKEWKKYDKGKIKDFSLEIKEAIENRKSETLKRGPITISGDQVIFKK